MAVQFVLGRAGAGKSEWMIRKARQLTLDDPHGPPVLLLVPEQATYQTEQNLLSGDVNATLRVRVLGFERLSAFALQYLPITSLRRLNDTHRQVLMTAIIARMRREGAAGNLIQARGIETTLLSMMGELREQRVSSERLRGLAASFEAAGNAALVTKLRQMADVAEAYEAALKGRFLDPEADLADLTHLLRTLPVLQGTTLFVDGFSAFPPMHQEILKALFLRCHQCYVTLTLDPNDYDRFRKGALPDQNSRYFPVEETIHRLLTLIANNPISLQESLFLPVENQPKRFRSAELEHIESAFLNPSMLAMPFQGDAANVRFLVAADPRDEARLAVEQLLDWREQKGWNWVDMAVVTRSLEGYAAAMEEWLQSLQVPYFLDRNAPLETHPLIQGTLAAMEAVVEGWRSGAVLAFAKSGLLRQVEWDDISRLEEFVRAYPRRMEDWLSEDDWPALSSRTPSPSDDPGAGGAPSVDAIRRTVSAPLRRLANGFRAARLEDGRIPFRAFLGALVSLLDEVTPANMDELPRYDAAALKELGELFEAMMEAAGEELFAFSVAAELTRETLLKLRLPRIPPLLNQVLVGSVDRSRFPALKGMVVIGLAEGSFPQAADNQTVLTDRDREEIAALGMADLRPSSRQAFNREAFWAYIAVTRASHALTLVRPHADYRGDALAPSPYYTDLRQCFPEKEEEVPPPHFSWARAQRPREAAAVLCREVYGTMDRGNPGPPPEADLIPAREGLEGKREREFLSVLRWARNRNFASLDPALAALFWPNGVMNTTVGALESYANCPFQWFMRALIRPLVFPPPVLTRADLSTLTHQALESLSAILSENGKDIRNIREEEIVTLVRDAFRGPLARVEAEGLFATPGGKAVTDLIRFQVTEAVRFLRKADAVLTPQILGTDIPFGGQNDFAAPKVQARTPQGPLEVEVRGRLDRVDASRGEDGNLYLYSVDYTLGKRDLNYSQVAAGLSLRMPISLLVLEENARRLTADPAEPPPQVAGAFSLPTISRFQDDRLFRGIASASASENLGLSGEEGTLLPPSGADPQSKTGGRGDVLSDAQFQRLLQEVREVIIDLVSGMASGRVEVSPAWFKNTVPCTTCPYRPACRLDYSMNHRRSIPALPRAEAIETWLGPPGGPPEQGA